MGINARGKLGVRRVSKNAWRLFQNRGRAEGLNKQKHDVKSKNADDEYDGRMSDRLQLIHNAFSVKPRPGVRQGEFVPVRTATGRFVGYRLADLGNDGRRIALGAGDIPHGSETQPDWSPIFRSPPTYPARTR